MENNQSQKEKILKLNFFEKIWYSVTKFEKYPELAAIGVKKALLYFTELILIFSIIYASSYIYYISNIVKYDEQDLNLSQKLVKNLNLENSDNEQTKNALELLNNYDDNTIIVSLFVSAFMALFVSIFLDVFTLSIFGELTCLIAKIKMNYKAVFNMSIYALTLSIILRMVYVVITMLTDFEIKYFEVMYIAIAYITLAAAIFLIKSDVIKQHLELMKILENSKEKIEQTITITKKPKDEEEENKENKDKNENKENKEEKDGEEQGSNA